MSSIGTLYAWSIFVAPIEAEFARSRSVTSIVFAVATTAFTVAMLAGDSITHGRSLRSSAFVAFDREGNYSTAIAAAVLAATIASVLGAAYRPSPAAAPLQGSK